MYVESFNGKPRDELLNRELFLGLDEALYVLDEWRRATTTTGGLTAASIGDPGGLRRHPDRS